MKTRYRLIGMATWVVTAAAVFLVLRSEMQAQSSSVSELTGELGSWLTSGFETYDAQADHRLWVALEDPIFVELPSGEYRQVGHVTQTFQAVTRNPVATDQLQLEIYDAAFDHFDGPVELEFYTASMSLDHVVKTMFPSQRRQEIGQLIRKTWEEEQDDIIERLKPVLLEGVRTAFDAVEEQLPAVLKRHKEDFRRIADRYEIEIVKADLLPLIKEQILPIVEEEAVPVAKEIGGELWKKVSLISFAWRFMYDKSPLPKRDAVKVEFQRFVDEDVIPILESRSDELLDVVETIVKRSMKNPEVRKVLKKNLKMVAEDAELHRLIWSVIREAVIENEVLKLRLEAHLNNERTKYAFQDAGEKMEEMVRTIGDTIFGTRESGITPEFSRVLRSQLLTKDRRWFVIVPADPSDTQDELPAGTLRLKLATESMIYPMGFGGTDQSPLTLQQN